MKTTKTIALAIICTIIAAPVFAETTTGSTTYTVSTGAPPSTSGATVAAPPSTTSAPSTVTVAAPPSTTAAPVANNTPPSTTAKPAASKHKSSGHHSNGSVYESIKSGWNSFITLLSGPASD